VDFARTRGATKEHIQRKSVTEEQRSVRAKDTENIPPDRVKPLLIFFGMLALVFLPMTPGIDHNDHENDKTQTDEHYYAGVVIPDRFQPICQLGPIHFAASYTAARQK
jgi:hypothetical protein